MNKESWNLFDYRSVTFDGSSTHEREVMAEFDRVGLTDVHVFRSNSMSSIGKFGNSMINVTFKNIPVIKAAYDSGAGRALFIDGEISFITDTNEIENALTYFPTEDDIVLFAKSYGASDDYKEYAPYWDKYDERILETECYSLSRRVMSLYLEIEESGKLPDYDWIKEITGSYAVNSLCYRY